MDTMRTRFIIAVTERLSAAADSTAKVELIEELSDNLYSRWQDLTAAGVAEEEAYRQALEDLGSVEELLAYLDSLGPEGELPRRDGGVRDFTSELLHGVEEVVRETVSQTMDAVDQAGEIVRRVADKIKEKYPDGFKGRVYVQVDGDKDGQTTAEAPGEPGEPEEGESREGRGWSFSMGYNRDRGGFYCESGRVRRVTGTAFPSQDIRGVDVQVVNGDISVHLSDDDGGDVVLAGDVDRLEVRMSDDGILSIRQGSTASSSFFSLRGLTAADVELTLPRRTWELLQLTTVNGDVDIDDGLDAGRLSIKTASGDVSFRQLNCDELAFKSASGDLDGQGVAGTVWAEAASGDVELNGAFGAVRAVTASGDIDICGSARELRLSSASGDVELETSLQPEAMEVSSKSGDCEIAMPGTEGFTLRFSSVSGELDAGFPLVGPMGARSGEAVYMDGGTRTYHVSSISGDITLRQL